MICLGSDANITDALCATIQVNMTNSFKTLLMIRPQAQAEEFVAELGMDMPVVYSALNRIDDLNPPQTADLPQPFLFTSANAVRAFARWKQPKGQTAICVGPITSDAARAAGFSVIDADGTAADVAAMVNGASATYLRGEKVSFDMKAALNDRGVSVTELILYRQTPKTLTQQARQVLETKTVIMPVFSQNAARRFCAEVQEIPFYELYIAAISPMVVRHFDCVRGVKTAVAETPNRAGMLKLLEKLA